MIKVSPIPNPLATTCDPTGQSNNVHRLADDSEYSFTGITESILSQLTAKTLEGSTRIDIGCYRVRIRLYLNCVGRNTLLQVPVFCTDVDGLAVLTNTDE